MPVTSIPETLEALRVGGAFVDLTAWRKVLVTGTEARHWLNDLLSADLAGLEPDRSRRTLLLSATGRIRADVTAAAAGEGVLLIQDPVQPSAIDRLLEPYVLSSDVALEDRTGTLALVAVPGGEPPPLRGAHVMSPSCLGPGADLVMPSREEAVAGATSAGLLEAVPEAAEAFRIERGAARFGVDLREESLPQEADLDALVAYDKGCFLGQEAMAKVRNLGHPPFRVLAARSVGPVAPGDPVFHDDEEVGTVTSAAAVAPHEVAAIVRVRWAARDSSLRTAAGGPLRILGPASGEA